MPVDDAPAGARSRRAARARSCTTRLRLVAAGAVLLPLAIVPVSGLVGGPADPLPVLHPDGVTTCC